MRTTVNLDEALLRAAKEAALRTGRTLTQVFEDALRAALTRGATDRDAPARYAVAASGAGGLLPGVDLDDTSSLLDVMDRHDRP